MTARLGTPEVLDAAPVLAQQPAIEEWQVPWERTRPRDPFVARDGRVWFSGNLVGYIGRLDPRDGRITRYPMPDSTVRDPRTLAFDSRGDIWFTAQGGNIVGKLTVKRGSRRRSSTFRLVAAAAAGT